MQIDVPNTPGAGIAVSVSMLSKTTTRLPESMFVTFNPPLPTGSSLLLSKLHEAVNASDVVPGGAQKLHFVQPGFVFQVCCTVCVLHCVRMCARTCGIIVHCEFV